MKLGTKIKRLRNKNGLTQEQFVNRIGIASRTLIRYENNQSQPGLEILKKIAKVLGVDTTYLTDEEESKISFKNWLKDYEYIPGTFKNLYFEENDQKENDDNILNLLNELKCLKRLPNKKFIDNEVLKYIYKCDFVQEYINELKDDGEKTGLFLLLKNKYFCDLQFIFSEYKKYLINLETNQSNVTRKVDQSLILLAKKMPPLYHKLPGGDYNIKKSEIRTWLKEQDESYEYLFKRLKDTRLIKYDKESDQWMCNDKRM